MAHAHKSATMDTAYIDTFRKVNLNNQIHLSNTHLLIIHVNCTWCDNIQSCLVSDTKCYCDHKEESHPQNTILCGVNGIFVPSGSCSNDEICIGPDNADDAICWNFKSDLCQHEITSMQSIIYII